MVTSAESRVGVALFDPEAGELVPAPWAASLLDLGTRLARESTVAGGQLIVAVSVPARDYAAVLVAAGWVLASSLAITDADPATSIADLAWGVPVRLVAGDQIVLDRFRGRQSGRSSRIQVGATYWPIDRLTALEAVEAAREFEFGRSRIPPAGGLVSAFLSASEWVRLASSTRVFTAVVGAKSRLQAEMDLRLTGGGPDAGLDRLGTILRPRGGRSPTWGSVLLAGGSEDMPEIPVDAGLVVLDGALGIRWLPEIAAPAVVALIDRSVVDDSATAVVMQARASGQSLPSESLAWQPPAGVEMLAFQAPL